MRMMIKATISMKTKGTDEGNVYHDIMNYYDFDDIYGGKYVDKDDVDNQNDADNDNDDNDDVPYVASCQLEMATMSLAPTHNVKAVKGFALKHFATDLAKCVKEAKDKSSLSVKNLKVTLNGKLVKDSDKLLALQSGKIPFVVVLI